MTNVYQQENLGDEKPFLGHICSIQWVLGFDQQEYPVGSR